MKKKAFTLIELIAVLVILAILALIVTPLVMNIIRKARISADKRSIDAYGRSIELAIAGYLLDTGIFPTNIEQLSINYSGDRVECSTTQLNSDSTVYLEGCTVGGRSVDYTYGVNENVRNMKFKFGSMVMYDGEVYYVIEDSNESDSSVKLFKAKPFSTEQVSNLLNNLNIDCQVLDNDGVGLVPFGVDNNYNNSNIIKILNEWKDSSNDSENIIDVRLLTKNELINDYGYEMKNINPSNKAYTKNDSTPEYIYDSQFYWSKDLVEDSVNSVYGIGDILSATNVNNSLAIRPVIEINKKSNILIALDYKVGDEITYNGVDYYVIANSVTSDSTVTLLKSEPLTVAEVNQYGGAGTSNNHINQHSNRNGVALDRNGYGGMQYYSSATCRADSSKEGCISDYTQSEIKYVVDSWKNDKAPLSREARLITYDELVDNLGYNQATWRGSYFEVNPDYTPSWVYNSKYIYWTMSGISNTNVWYVLDDGDLDSHGDYSYLGVTSMYEVRPVIVLDKSLLSS